MTDYNDLYDLAIKPFLGKISDEGKAAIMLVCTKTAQKNPDKNIEECLALVEQHPKVIEIRNSI